MADENIIMGHAEDNDGIEEYDNSLPDWWLALFFACIIWGGIYAVMYHGYQQTSQEKLYLAEVAAAEEQWGGAAEVDLAAVEITPELIAAGEPIFTQNCVACHAADLTGGVGPNLVDEEWIHGGEYADIVKTVTDGVPAKGMLTWGPILGDEKVRQVSAYVYSKSHQAN
ncbi:MAG: c-type cytochrome [Deltaproteobacteria bacterium]|nr:MAG: c-type cytochrome [Deltaproteobacteria bacterium]